MSTAEDEQTRERRERAEQDARRKAVAAEYDADQARARLEAAATAPQLTRTEAVKAPQAGLCDDYYDDTTETRRHCSLAHRHKSPHFYSRIDAALAKPTPARAMEAATTVFDETPLDAARRELEELVHGPVHPSHMVTLVDCAIDKLVAASRSETFNANESGWRHAAETQNRLWSKKCTDLSEERFAHQETRADRDRLRREASLALDAVTQLRRVHAELGRLIETMTVMLKDGGGQ